MRLTLELINTLTPSLQNVSAKVWTRSGWPSSTADAVNTFSAQVVDGFGSLFMKKNEPLVCESRNKQIGKRYCFCFELMDKVLTAFPSHDSLGLLIEHLSRHLLY